MNTLLSWHIYDVISTTSSLNGVMLRGRIRKLGLEKQFNVLAENTEDRENGVRFAVLNEEDATAISLYLQTLASDISVQIVKNDVRNPVLSKLKINNEDRYKL